MLALVWQFLEPCKRRMASTGKKEKYILIIVVLFFIQSDSYILIEKMQWLYWDYL